MTASITGESSETTVNLSLPLHHEDEEDELHVTWRDEVEGQITRLLSFSEASPHNSVPVASLPAFSEALNKKTVTSCLTGCWDLIKEFFVVGLTPLPSDESPRKKKDERKRHEFSRWGRNEFEGALWKFRHRGSLTHSTEDEPTLQESTCVASWRERLFFLRWWEGRLALIYISEKDNGKLCLACILKGAYQVAVVKKLQPVELKSLTGEEEYEVLNNMRLYNIAFKMPTVGKHALRNRSSYEPVVPEKLYPILVRWVDDHGAEQLLVFAANSETARDKWLRTIAEATPPK
eukprot:gnl/TRDRNA2_/TRDRNA2_42970_c0_seq1.p1 gnl/TRDRNA2_/TRDRNA2_42970_c0~~gnl/TRDRNA2_/TRDRNA2_42970_c0_seq1.p1  ORF type:complete len:319 (+),score=49.29 gnl/TRDRNA2_/TRDRNA2_42970_c0_seq1:86-958(+)